MVDIEVAIKEDEVIDVNIHQDEVVVDILTPPEIITAIQGTGPRGLPGVGVPSGGLVNQLLKKRSNVDFDTEWTDITVPSAAITKPAALANGAIIGTSSDYARADHAHPKPTPTELGFCQAICTTAEQVTEKVAIYTDLSNLYINAYITVKFINAVPANSTLNVNNYGAYPMYYHGEAIIDGVIKAGDYATFIFTGARFVLVGVDRIPSTSDIGAIAIPTSAIDGDVLTYDATSGQWVAEAKNSGTLDYEELINKPQIEGVSLIGNRTFANLNLNVLTNMEIEELLSL